MMLGNPLGSKVSVCDGTEVRVGPTEGAPDELGLSLDDGKIDLTTGL